MSIRLTVKQRSAAGGADKPAVVMLDDDVITLGRDTTCQVVLAQQAVSRTHARISRDGTLYFVQDLGSSYGTQINGAKLPRGEKHLLRNGDVIAIAQFDVTFDRVADSSPDGGSGNTQFVARKVVKDVMRGLAAGGELPYFRIMNTTREGERFEISDAQEYIIGRDETADIILKDELVSRRHVKVRRDWSGTHVEDLGSRNGIKVNKKRSPKATLKDRDEVEVGTYKLLYIDPGEVREAPLVLPEDDNEEATVAPAPDDEPSAKSARPSTPDGPDEAQGEDRGTVEAPADAPGDEAPPADEPAPEDPPADEPPDEAEHEGEVEDAVPRRLAGIDLANKPTLIALGIAGVVTLIAIVVIILVLAGV